MERNKKLVFNIGLYTISNFTSKFLALLLIPVYTNILTTSQYGIVDILVTANSLLVPVITMNISESVLRYTVTQESDRNCILSTGLISIVLANICSLFFVFLLTKYLGVSQYYLYLVGIIFFNSLYSLVAQFCKGQSKNLFFAIGGVLQTAVLILSNIVLLVCLNWKIEGYLISIFLSYLIPFLYMFIGAKVYKHLEARFNRLMFVEMLKFSAPLVPNTIFWWIMNASDKFFINGMLGIAYNGIYAISNKIPSILNMISVIFSHAWQLSAIEQVESKDRNEYYNKTFYYLSLTMIYGMAIIFIVIKPFFKFCIHPTYHEGWQYSWILLFATMFMSFSSFWGTNLMAVKKNVNILKSSVLGGGINIILNFLLIPAFGLYGASIATLVGALLMFIVRLNDSKACLNLKLDYNYLVVSVLILMIQGMVLYLEHYLIYEIIIFGVLILVNKEFLIDVFKMIRIIYKKLLKKG